MTTHEFLSSALAVAIGAACGFALGLAYFALLRRAIAEFAAQRGRQRLLLWSVARMLAAAVLLAAVAELGPAALLAALLGFVAARTRLLRACGTDQAQRTGEP